MQWCISNVKRFFDSSVECRKIVNDINREKIEYTILNIACGNKRQNSLLAAPLCVQEDFMVRILVSGSDISRLRRIGTACGVHRQVLLVSGRSIYYSPATVEA